MASVYRRILYLWDGWKKPWLWTTTKSKNKQILDLIPLSINLCWKDITNWNYNWWMIPLTDGQALNVRTRRPMLVIVWKSCFLFWIKVEFSTKQKDSMLGFRCFQALWIQRWCEVVKVYPSSTPSSCSLSHRCSWWSGRRSLLRLFQMNKWGSFFNLRPLWSIRTIKSGIDIRVRLEQGCLGSSFARNCSQLSVGMKVWLFGSFICSFGWSFSQLFDSVYRKKLLIGHMSSGSCDICADHENYVAQNISPGRTDWASSKWTSKVWSLCQIIEAIQRLAPYKKFDLVSNFPLKTSYTTFLKWYRRRTSTKLNPNQDTKGVCG